ncbi:MAG: TonB-dependent receptor plug domain-containing protein, partial [Butyricimonas paravirosa]
VSNTNLVSAISMLTPGMRMVENNAFGSNPNRMPEIVIRGTSSLSTEADQSANQPVIMLDGVEITMRDLYDIDINDIERVDVLKDASATALYGEKAANGVIVIERKRVLNDKLRLSYNLDGALEVPDLRSYDYLNAKDKLEFERLAGLYNFSLLNDFEEYNRKKILISKGMDTDWMSALGYTINSIGASGRGNGMTYRLNANVRTVKGVRQRLS